METVKQKRAIAKAENANAWLILTAAQANRDTQQFGEWRMDYITVAAGHQAEFDVAMSELEPK